MRLDPFLLARAVATLDAAERTRDAGAASEHRLLAEGGMRMHLRLAIGGRDAAELHRTGRAGWTVGSLTGHNMKAGDVPNPPISAGEDAAILVALSTLSEWSRHGSAFLDASSMARIMEGRAGANRLEGLPRWIGELTEDDVSDRRRAALRHMCGMLGFGDPCGQPLDVDGLWTRHHVEGVVAAVTNDGGGWSNVLVDQADDRRIRFRWKADERHCGIWSRTAWNKPATGERLRIEYAGRTPEHRGYVACIRNLEEIEEGRRIKALAELLGRPAPVARYADGTAVRPRDEVVITASCLEVASGAEGRVTSTCGELAMVRFRGRRRPVPCYPDNLERISGETPDAIAA